ncbi:unnamed protein product, partial [Timema podura]|nr:unnamed protein product [Timema podura]
VNQLVDVGHTVQRYVTFRPNKRALRAKKDSTLLLGRHEVGVRYLGALMHHKDIYTQIAKREVLTCKMMFIPTRDICSQGCGNGQSEGYDRSIEAVVFPPQRRGDYLRRDIIRW